MVVIGIDGGVSGAIAFMYDDAPPVVADLPTMATDGGAFKNRIHGPTLSKLLTQHCAGHTSVRPFIESISSGGMGRGNANSVGSQYDSFATVRCVMEMRGMVLVDLSPARWKSMYGLVNRRNTPVENQKGKKDSLVLARDLFPDLAQSMLRRVEDHNRAEALLIANFAKKVFS